jgi:hypothetical protein
LFGLFPVKSILNAPAVDIDVRDAELEGYVALGLAFSGSPDNHILPLGFVVPATLAGAYLLESNPKDLRPAFDGRDGEA